MVETRQRRKGVLWSQIESVQDVFSDILSRLPVQSIRSFQTINKYWYGSIRSKFFAKQHLYRSRENPTFIVGQTRDSAMKLYSMKPGSFKLSDVNRIDPSERSHGEEMHIISSFNGLICCINRIYDKDVESELCDLQIWICNPCTGETLLLPQGRPSYHFVPSVGVAYYSNTSDYLVFRIFCVGKKSPEERVFDGYDYPDGHMVRKYQYALAYECEVYSSNTGSWRNIGPVPCLPMNSYYSPFRSAHVFVGGKVYWLSSLVGRGKILSVDLRGKFKVIKLPRYSTGLKEEDSITEGSYLINLRGALSMVVLHPGYMDTWVWKEGDKKSSTWVCEYVDKNPNDDDLELVLAMTSSGKQIMCMTDERWCYFDVETGTWTKKRVNSAEFESPVVFPFTESVLPCNGGLMV